MPKPNIGWMAQVVQGKRSSISQEMDHLAGVFHRAWLKLEKYQGGLFKPDKLETYFEYTHAEICRQVWWTEEQAQEVLRRMVNLYYGDPLIMSSVAQRQFSVPYWNPTKHRLNIAPMGLVASVDEKTREATFHEFLDPGAHIMIPHGYTVGGKHSTVAGVAPQLQPLPRQEDTELDLHPLTYTEWCTFGSPGVSKCCQKQVVWSDGHGSLMCVKCGNLNV